MESPQAVFTARPPCDCHTTETNSSKILHSILSYHFNHYDLSLNREGGAGSSCSSPTCSSPREAYSPASSYASGYHSPSPALVPSPSPPAWTESRLYNILKGTASSSSSSGYSSSPSPPSGTEEQPLNLKRARVPSADEPIDLSCKKSRNSLSGSSDYVASPSPYCTASSPMDLSSRSSTPRSVSAASPNVCLTINGQALDNVTALNNNNNTTQSSSGSSSILESILCGRVSSGLLGGGRPQDASGSGHRLDNQDLTSRLSYGNQVVTLAKKNLMPVSARVSDWLVKIVRFAQSVPEFMSLAHNDKVQLVLHSWCRIMLLYMAETNFQFAVTPKSAQESDNSSGDCEGRTSTTSSSSLTSAETPTMKSVECIQRFIRKCQNMNLDPKEYDYLRLIILFHQGYRDVDDAQCVDNMNALVRQCLQDHIRLTRPNDKMRYSRLLLCLPTLFGINCKMVEKLFCKHISTNMDVEVLLKEMLQRL